MDLFLKILALVMVGCAATLVLRDGGFRQLAVVACCCLAGVLVVDLLRPVLNFAEQLVSLSTVSSTVFEPVLKASAIGILCQVAGNYCQDAGEKALAGMLELGGVLSILYVSLPLFTAVLDMLKTLMGD